MIFRRAFLSLLCLFPNHSLFMATNLSIYSCSYGYRFLLYDSFYSNINKSRLTCFQQLFAEYVPDSVEFQCQLFQWRVASLLYTSLHQASLIEPIMLKELIKDAIAQGLYRERWLAAVIRVPRRDKPCCCYSTPTDKREKRRFSRCN